MGTDVAMAVAFCLTEIRVIFRLNRIVMLANESFDDLEYLLFYCNRFVNSVKTSYK